jgi:hypothetical protein
MSLPIVSQALVQSPFVDPQTGILTPAAQQWFAGVSKAVNLLANSPSATIVTAPLTGGGTEGRIVYQNGVIIDEIPAT